MKTEANAPNIEQLFSVDKTNHSFQKRYFSLINPTKEIHFGIYFGVLTKLKGIQDEYPNKLHLMLANYSAIAKSGSSLYDETTYDIICQCLALGLKVDKSVIAFTQSGLIHLDSFQQILSQFIEVKKLSTLFAYKNSQRKTVAELVAPLTMVSAIMGLMTTNVIVGQDRFTQTALAREIAKNVNKSLPGRFPVPIIEQSATGVVPGLDGEPMSITRDNYLPIFCEAGTLKQRIHAIKIEKSNSDRISDHDNCPIYKYFKYFKNDVELEEIKAMYAAGSKKTYDHLKLRLYTDMYKYFTPFRDEYEVLKNSQMGLIKEITAYRSEMVNRQMGNTLEMIKQVLKTA